MAILFKKGPHGTLRRYDSASGRYCTGSVLAAVSHNRSKKKPKASEKEAMRRAELYSSAKSSKDKCLFEVYSRVEDALPGTVKQVNVNIYDPYIKDDRELDIITKTHIVEVKSGFKSHNVTQFLGQMKLAELHKKKHCVYMPKASNHKIWSLRHMGINVYNDIDELTKELSK